MMAAGKGGSGKLLSLYVSAILSHLNAEMHLSVSVSDCCPLTISPLSCDRCCKWALRLYVLEKAPVERLAQALLVTGETKLQSCKTCD